MKLALQTCSLLVLVICFAFAQAQAPVADLDYMPPISSPAYSQNSGPLVRIDEAHHNYHTLDGRYAAFAGLLRRDGFRLEPSKSEFSTATLAGASIMVIANAEAAQSGKEFASAFSSSEIAAIRQWVEQGGALLIIADHPPFSDSAAALAEAFGFELESGVALNPPSAAGQFDPIVVFAAGKGLTPSVLSAGRLPAEQVDSVMTFTGSAFRAPSAATSVLVFQEGARSYPSGPTGPDFTSPGTPIAGLSQGAILELGKGRVAVFGEAAMFTAQRGGPNSEPMGMNTPGAGRNYQFVLNLVHWLGRAKARRAM
jgi:hypothetical protein